MGALMALTLLLLVLGGPMVNRATSKRESAGQVERDDDGQADDDPAAARRGWADMARHRAAELVLGDTISEQVEVEAVESPPARELAWPAHWPQEGDLLQIRPGHWQVMYREPWPPAE
jgi:hypothetical protein